MTVLIGLNGFKRSGKNTVGNFIAQWGEERGFTVYHRGFADYVKLSAARSLGLATNLNDAIVLMDGLKEMGDIQITIPDQSIMRAITGREFIKWFATEGHRDVFGNDFWIDLILPPQPDWSLVWAKQDGDGEWIAPEIAVITDLRFANEARRVRSLNGRVWNVDRGLHPDEDGHMSEQPLPKGLVDRVIPNRTTLEALELEVNKACSEQIWPQLDAQRILRK